MLLGFFAIKSNLVSCHWEIFKPRGSFCLFARPMKSIYLKYMTRY